LCAFARVSVPKDKAARLSIEIPAERFRYGNGQKNNMSFEPGNYELLVGSASDDIRLRIPLKITAK